MNMTSDEEASDPEDEGDEIDKEERLLKTMERQKLKKEKRRKEVAIKRSNKKGFKDFLKVSEYGHHARMNDGKGEMVMKSKIYQTMFRGND